MARFDATVVGSFVLLVVVAAPTAWFGADLFVPREDPVETPTSRILFDSGTSDAAWAWATTSDEYGVDGTSGDLTIELSLTAAEPEGLAVYLNGEAAAAAECFPGRAEPVGNDELPTHVREAFVDSYSRPAAHGRLIGLREEEGRKEAEDLFGSSFTVVIRMDDPLPDDDRTFDHPDGPRTASPEYGFTTCSIPAGSAWAESGHETTLTWPIELMTGVPAHPGTSNLVLHRGLTIYQAPGTSMTSSSKAMKVLSSTESSLDDQWSIWDTESPAVVLSSFDATFEPDGATSRHEWRVFLVSLGVAVSAALVTALLKRAGDALARRVSDAVARAVGTL